MKRYTAPKAIANHPGVEECLDASGDSDYKHDIWLRDGWRFTRGRNDGCQGCHAHSVADFRYARPMPIEQINNTNEQETAAVSTTKTKSKARYRIRETAWGNWYGYLGSKRVECFGASSTETQQQAAERWLREKTLRDPRRIADALTVPTTKTATATPAPDAWVALVLKSMGDAELDAESTNTANTDAERQLMRDELARRRRPITSLSRAEVLRRQPVKGFLR